VCFLKRVSFILVGEEGVKHMWKMVLGISTEISATFSPSFVYYTSGNNLELPTQERGTFFGPAAKQSNGRVRGSIRR